jgi:hypothetical protein
MRTWDFGDHGLRRPIGSIFVIVLPKFLFIVDKTAKRTPSNRGELDKGRARNPELKVQAEWTRTKHGLNRAPQNNEEIRRR